MKPNCAPSGMIASPTSFSTKCTRFGTAGTDRDPGKLAFSVPVNGQSRQIYRSWTWTRSELQDRLQRSKFCTARPGKPGKRLGAHRCIRFRLGSPRGRDGGRRLNRVGTGEANRQFRASATMLVDSCEYNLYQITQKIENSRLSRRWSACICDVRDETAMRHLFMRKTPDIVFHVAALKHVPLLESHNVIEAVLTNVQGTKIVLDLSISAGADFVAISTDKAVNPSSLMGLTKRVAEICVHDRAVRHPAQGSASFDSVTCWGRLDLSFRCFKNR